MKIAFFEISDSEKDYLEKTLTGHELKFNEEKLTLENIGEVEDYDCVSVFINSVIHKDVLDQLPNLKLIVTRSTGFDHIDRVECANRNIAVTNIPTYGSRTVAEFVFALLLSVSRKIIDASINVKFTDTLSYQGLCGFDLYGKTLGVIGTGKIGKNVIDIALGFGMKVLAYDLHPDESFAQEKNIQYVSFDELLSNSDIVTLHMPLTDDNKHIINKEAITKMKKGVVIINTARGELIDTDALIWGINEKIISGAGLDVLELERAFKGESQIVENSKIITEDHILMHMKEVVVTPHLAFYSKEAVENILEITVGNINSFIAGNTQNLVK